MEPQTGGTARGLKFSLLGKKYRVWLKGMEVGDDFGGKIIFSPWHRLHKWRLVNKIEKFFGRV